MADRTIEVKVVQQNQTGNGPGSQTPFAGAPAASQLPPPPAPPGTPAFRYLPIAQSGAMSPEQWAQSSLYQGYMQRAVMGVQQNNQYGYYGSTDVSRILQKLNLPQAQYGQGGPMGGNPMLASQFATGQSGMMDWMGMMATGHAALGGASVLAGGAGLAAAGVGLTYASHHRRLSYNPYGINNPYASGDAGWNTATSLVRGGGDLARKLPLGFGSMAALPFDLAEGGINLTRELFTNVDERRKIPGFSSAAYERQDRISQEMSARLNADIRIEDSQNNSRVERARAIEQSVVSDRFNELPGSGTGKYFTRRAVLGESTEDTGRVNRALLEAKVLEEESVRSVTSARQSAIGSRGSLDAAAFERDENVAVRERIKRARENWEKTGTIDQEVGKMVGWSPGGWLNGDTGEHTKFGMMTSQMEARYDRIIEQSNEKVEMFQQQKNRADGAFKREQERQAQLVLNREHSELNLKRDTLNAARRHEEVIKSGTLQYETMMPGEQRFILRSAEKLAQEGAGALDPRMKSALLGNQWTREWASRKLEEAGGADDTAKRIKEIAGVGDLNDVRQRGDRLEADITKQEQKMKADHQQRLAKINADFAKEAENAIENLANALIQKMKNQANKTDRERAEQIKVPQ